MPPAMAALRRREGPCWPPWATSLQVLALDRQRGRAGAEAALHQDDVEPALEIPARGLEHAAVLEAARAVHGDRAVVVGVADHGQHLANAERFAARDQFHQQQLA